MKKVIICFALFLASTAIHESLIAQDIYAAGGPVVQRKIHKVPVVTAYLGRNVEHVINPYNPISIVFPPAVSFGSVKTTNHLAGYRYDQLKEVALKPKRASLRGAWQGALIGLGAGFIAGLLSGDDPAIPAYNNPNDPFGSALNIYTNAIRITAAEKALTLGIIGAGAGGAIGALLQSLLKKKHITGRKKQKDHLMRQNILENFTCTN